MDASPSDMNLDHPIAGTRKIEHF
ncbi:hypothetical protein MESS2_1650015 [Mesorhizobium metallidurans STM 2683]|uniref:Uncharacterized protein n=1 Tax=Mesorhizobium metallidurans STM 2683 TaxID=1297569 RepID=M5EN23_9HYPH|nr:hypothetical protein MESS2_1650015 [Mesorhizobium metallidurans STM 2683]